MVQTQRGGGRPESSYLREDQRRMWKKLNVKDKKHFFYGDDKAFF